MVSICLKARCKYKKQALFLSCFGVYTDFSYFLPGLFQTFCCVLGAVFEISAVSATFCLVFSGHFESSPNLCVNSSFSYVVLSTLLLSSRDLTEWSLVYHSTLSYQRFYDLHSIHYDHLEGLHQSVV